MKNPRYITVDTISDSDYNNRNRVYLGGGDRAHGIGEPRQGHARARGGA